MSFNQLGGKNLIYSIVNMGYTVLTINYQQQQHYVYLSRFTQGSLFVDNLDSRMYSYRHSGQIITSNGETDYDKKNLSRTNR